MERIEPQGDQAKEVLGLALVFQRFLGRVATDLSPRTTVTTSGKNVANNEPPTSKLEAFRDDASAAAEKSNPEAEL